MERFVSGALWVEPRAWPDAGDDAGAPLGFKPRSERWRAVARKHGWFAKSARARTFALRR